MTLTPFPVIARLAYLDRYEETSCVCQSSSSGAYAAGALTGDGPVSVASISSKERPLVSKPMNQ